MEPSFDVRKINVGSYRFNGYKLKRDLDNNIIETRNLDPQPGHWKTRALSAPDNYTQYPYRENSNG